MKLNKKQVGLVAGVVCVILLTILLLSMCNGGSQDKTETGTAATETSGVTIATTEPTEETTEEIAEETTEATEETTEATEEATEGSTGGSSTPGGTGGPGLGSGSVSGDTVEPTTPKAGSEESPYLEVVAQFPDTVSTVSIPAEGTVHYNLSLLDESVARYGESLLIIEGENVSVIYNENTYEAVNGIVSVPLVQELSEEEVVSVAEGDAEAEPEEEAEEPVSIRIFNGAAEARVLSLVLDAPMGTVDNPEEILRGENGALDFAANLEENDQNGYFFSIEAERDGKLLLIPETDAESGVYDMIVTAGGVTKTWSGDGDADSLAMEFEKGDQVLIQFLARAAEDGSRPSAKAKITGYADYYGSKTNPIEVDKDFTTEEMEPGLELYYLIRDQKGMALNVEYPAYVIFDGKTYQESLPETETEIPVITVKIGNGDSPVLMAIGNGGEEAAAFDVTFTHPSGHEENKAQLVIRDDEAGVDGLNTAVIEDGDTDVYWFTWTNNVDTGILTIKMPEQGNWKYAITHTSGTNVTSYDMTYSDSDPVVSVCSIVMKYDDTVDIQVCTYDPADQTAMPAGSVTFAADFLTHTLIAPTGDTWLTLDGGEMVYCKQGLKYADGAIMSIVAVETDEEGNAKLDEDGNVIVLTDRAFTIDYEGVVYTSADGMVVVEGIEMESTNPDIFSFTNDGSEKTLYRVSFSYPEGHQSNPRIITLGKYQIELYGDGGSGYYCSWTTSEPATFRFDIDPSTYWTYSISSSASTAVYSSTNNGSANADYKTSYELIVSRSDLNASSDGKVTLTINLGNPSSDPENKSLISFEIGVYNKKVTGDATVTVNAGEEIKLLQELKDTSASGMMISGNGNFNVIYDGTLHTAESGAVTVSNFRSEKTYFSICNNSDEAQEYRIQMLYPLGSEKNPEQIETDQQKDIALKDFAVDELYYYSWTAPADGQFQFDIIGNLQWRPWIYEIVHGENTYSGSGVQYPIVTTQSFDVKASDVVIIKIGVSRLDQTTVVPIKVTFTEAQPVQLTLTDPTVTEYQGSHDPVSFALTVAQTQELAYSDLSVQYSPVLNDKDGFYYLSNEGPLVLVDFSSDAFINLQKLIEDQELYCDFANEDGTVRETYNALLRKYLACAQVIETSEGSTQTLYPLTEDLMYILKNTGAQLGWYDSTDAGYLFGSVTAPRQESLWMFACCTVQEIPQAAQVLSEESVPTEEAADTE